MDDTVDIGMGSEHLVHSLFICYIDLIEMWSFPAQKLNPIERHLRGIVQAIDDYDLVAMFKEREGRERPNVTGATVRSNISILSLICAWWGNLMPRGVSTKSNTCGSASLDHCRMSE